MISHAIIVKDTDKNYKSQCALSGTDIYSCYTGASKEPQKARDNKQSSAILFLQSKGITSENEIKQSCVYIHRSSQWSS